MPPGSTQVMQPNPTNAMPRIPLLDETSHPDLRPLIDLVKSQRNGRCNALYRCLLNSPPVAQAWLQFFTTVRQGTELPGDIRELVILQTSALNGANEEFKAHVPLALKEGLTQEQVNALPAWADSGLFDTAHAAVLAWCDSVTRDVTVSDAVFAGVGAIFEDKLLLELTVTIAAYNMVARTVNGLQIVYEAAQPASRMSA